MLKITKRAELPALLKSTLQLGAIAAALIVAAMVILLWNFNPISVYKEMLFGAVGSGYRLQETINKMIPLLIMGLGMAVCFRMHFINIGAEGQFYMGVIAATLIVRIAGENTTSGVLPVMMIAALIAGGLWCLIPALLKLKWGVNETLVTLMMNYIATKLASYLQYTAWKDPKAYGFPKIANYPDAALLPKVFGIHCGWIIAIVLAVIIYILLFRSKLGYEISVMGENPRTARYAGINTAKVLVLSVLIGGGLCGLAGMIQASGIEKTMNDQMSGGMGFTAIIVAYMAKLNPIVLAIVAFFFAALLQGGAYIQSSLQIPADAAEVMQGIILLFIIGCDFFTRYKFELDTAERRVRV
jgi:simple sugar transport system permease protein